MKSERESVPLMILGMVLTLAGCLLLWRVLPGYMDSLAAERIKDTAMLPPEISLTPAPNIALVDQQGESCRLEDFVGQPVVMLFWIRSDGHDQAEIMDFMTAAGQREDARFLSVLVDGNPDNSAEIAEQMELDPNLLFLMDEDRSIARAFGVRAVPTTIFLDADGHIGGMVEGRLNTDAHNTGIDALFMEHYSG